MKRKRRKHTILKVIILLLILLAAAAAVWWFLNGRSWEIKNRNADNPMLVTQDSTAVVSRDTIRRSAEGSGTLEASRELSITAEHTLGIDTVYVQTGDSVNPGDLIASVDIDSIDEQVLALSNSLNETNTALSNTSRDGSSSLTSPVSGRVRRIFAREGDLLSEVMVRSGGIAQIAAAGELKVEFTPSSDAVPGMGVTVRFEDHDEEYEADGYIAQVQDGIATAVFDDKEDYDVDLEADVYDKADHLLGSGLTDCRYPYLIEGTYGKVDDIRVSEGDWVDSGSTILTRTEVAYNAAYRSLLTEREKIMQQLMELRQLRENPVILAEKNGIISSVSLRDKAPVREKDVMYTLMLTDRYCLKAQVDELDIEGVRDGQSVADELFGTTDVIGKTFRLSGKDFRVVGLLEEGQETLMGSINDSVYIPFTTAQRLFSNTAISTFYVSASDTDSLEEAERVLKNVLRDKFGDEDRYSVVNLTDVMDIIDRVMDTLSLLLGAIAGISLLVGGIGIMNIMLVSVTERTREIGIRKAIGALKGDIILQFLIESVILSLLGGIIGMAISWGVLSTINRLYPDYHFAVTPTVAAVSLGFSFMVGVIFGIYPANKAANLKPINALRYE